MDLGLKGKTALVLGGSSGIGYAIAEELCREGATVIVASRDRARVDAAVEKLRAIARETRGETVDLRDESSIRELWRRDSELDILVNNVGGPATGLPTEIPLAEWDHGYQSLVRSVLLNVQLAVPAMRRKQWGRILTVTSTSAREIIPRLPVSSTFRAALTALAKELAKELGRSGILVNNLLPGPVNTERLKHLATDSPAFFESMARETAVGRVAEPHEIGKAAAFLVSAANTYLTGTDVLVDGGFTKAL